MENVPATVLQINIIPLPVTMNSGTKKKATDQIKFFTVTIKQRKKLDILYVNNVNAY